MPVGAMLQTNVLDDPLIKAPFTTNFASPRDHEDQEPVAANSALEPPVIAVNAHADGGRTLVVQVEGASQQVEVLPSNRHQRVGFDDRIEEARLSLPTKNNL